MKPAILLTASLILTLAASSAYVSERARRVEAELSITRRDQEKADLIAELADEKRRAAAERRWAGVGRVECEEKLARVTEERNAARAKLRREGYDVPE